MVRARRSKHLPATTSGHPSREHIARPVPPHRPREAVLRRAIPSPQTGRRRTAEATAAVRRRCPDRAASRAANRSPAPHVSLELRVGGQDEGGRPGRQRALLSFTHRRTATAAVVVGQPARRGEHVVQGGDLAGVTSGQTDRFGGIRRQHVDGGGLPLGG